MRRDRSLILVNPIQWGQAPIQIRRVRGLYAPAPSDLSSLRPAQAQARSWLDSSVSGPAPIQVCSVWGCRSFLLGQDGPSDPVHLGPAPIQIRRVRGLYAPAPSDSSSLRPAQAQARSWLDSSVSGPAPVQVCSLWGCSTCLLGHAMTARRIQSTWVLLRSRSANWACTLPLRPT